MKKEIAVYIHIPFCNTICSYCDFCKQFYNATLVDKYLLALKEEINNRYQGEIVKSIYIGGGTPSSLNPKQLEKLFSFLNIFSKKEDCSITIEGNFESTTKEKLLLYKKYHINRLSFGIESINKNNLNLLERSLNISKVKEIINMAKQLNFSLNVDLMYALPHETISILQKDLDFIFSLNVDHISTYSLIIEDNTKLKLKGSKNISEDLDFKMYQLICQNMQKKGYIHYEISNFCLKDHESLHNLCYWHNENYYGFGLGAASYIENKRMTNTKSLTSYLNKKYLYEIIELTLKDTIEYEIILNLRLKEGINLKKFSQKYHHPLDYYYHYESLLKDNLLILKKGNLFISENKWYISNEIIRRFLEGERNE